MKENKNNSGNRRLRKVSSWMSDAVRAIEHEEEYLIVKKIVLKVLRYMEDNHLSQKDLAEKLGVSPQYISKFLHGQDMDIKISTAVRYGRILNIDLIAVPDNQVPKSTNRTMLFTLINNYPVKYGAKPDYYYHTESRPLTYN